MILTTSPDSILIRGAGVYLQVQLDLLQRTSSRRAQNVYSSRDCGVLLSRIRPCLELPPKRTAATAHHLFRLPLSPFSCYFTTCAACSAPAAASKPKAKTKAADMARGSVLCVAEKPSIAKAVAGHLSGGQYQAVCTCPSTMHYTKY